MEVIVATCDFCGRGCAGDEYTGIPETGPNQGQRVLLCRECVEDPFPEDIKSGHTVDNFYRDIEKISIHKI